MTEQHDDHCWLVAMHDPGRIANIVHQSGSYFITLVFGANRIELWRLPKANMESYCAKAASMLEDHWYEKGKQG